MAFCDEKNMCSISVSGLKFELSKESNFPQGLNLSNPEGQHSRTLSRITLNYLHGRSLTQCFNAQGLITSLKQVVQAQGTLYLQHGTVHRDISISNILIFSTESSSSPKSQAQSQVQGQTQLQTETQAALIDFDHHQPLDLIPSLLGAVHALPLSTPNSNSNSDETELPWKHAKDYLKLTHPDLPPLDEDVERLLGMYLDEWGVEMLLGMELQAAGDCLQDKITPGMLGLFPKDQLIPNPQASHHSRHQRSPTLPFSSCEHLTQRRVNLRKKPRPPLSSSSESSTSPSLASDESGAEYTWESWLHVLRRPYCKLYSHHWHPKGGGHDVVHDAESLFWVLTWIFLAPNRSGPEDEFLFERELLRTELFDSTQHSPATLGLEKRGVLTYETPFEPTKYFSSNFKIEPVIKLWRGWRGVIELAYEMVTFEDVLLGMEKEVGSALEGLYPSGPEDELSFERDFIRKELFDSTQHTPVTLGLEKSKVLTYETSHDPTEYFSSGFKVEPVMNLWRGWRGVIELAYEMVTFEDVLLGMEGEVDCAMEGL